MVWVQHFDEQLAKGSDDWRIVPELAPGDAEPLVEKSYGDSFEDTTLENVLSGLAIGRLVVVGAQTDACIRSTLHGALVRGYDATLVSDAHTTEDQTRLGSAAAGPGHRAYEPVLGRTRRRPGGRLERSRPRTSTSAAVLNSAGRSAADVRLRDQAKGGRDREVVVVYSSTSDSGCATWTA